MSFLPSKSSLASLGTIATRARIRLLAWAAFLAGAGLGRPRRALRLCLVALGAAWIAFGWIRVGTVLAHLPLRSPPPTPLFEDREGGFITDGQAVYGSLGYWDLGKAFPPKIEKAVVAIEDRRFRFHPGVDPYGLARAVVHNLRGRREGASTIAMQVVRLGYPRRRTLLAKADEMAGALLAELVYGKERVLRQYLKVLPQGGNMYGIAYAARRYFRKPAEDLSWAQVSLLLAIPQDPSGRNLFDFAGFRAARLRARVILGQLEGQGVIDAETAAAGRDELAAIPPFEREERPANAYHFMFRVMEEYARSPRAGIEKPIRTTLDPGVQETVERLAVRAMNGFRKLGADNMGLIVADPASGDVLAYLGSNDYFDAANKGAINYCSILRSSGSTLKPFIYSLGLESGRYGPDAVLADMPLRIKDSRGEYSLTDFDDSYMGPLLYRVALGNSRNVPAIRVLDGVGLEPAYEWLGRFGIHNNERPAGFYGYGLAVGGIYTSLERLAAAYGVLASEGRRFRLGWTLDRPAESPDRLMSEDTAREMTLFLSNPENRLPSFEGTDLVRFPFPVALKTGTSNGYRDAWILAYSRKYLVGVWVGHSDHRAMNHLAGSTVAALALEVFESLQGDQARGIDEELFPPPRDAVAVRLCPLSGKLAGPDCPKAVLEYFGPGKAPEGQCDVHRRVIVDVETGRPADLSVPLERRALKVETVLGPEYAAYAQGKGFAVAAEDPESLQRAAVRLTAPLDGIRIYIDPETPAKFQTLALRAEVESSPSELVWLVDGKEFARAPFPYDVRWPLSPGKHSFQARFPRALVESEPVSVTVLGP